MNEFFKNMAQAWSGIPAGRRIPIVITALVVVIGLTSIILYANKPKMAVLFSNMQPSEASKVVEFVKQKKLPYELADGGRAVMVPDANVYDLRLSLAAAGIPRAADTEGGVGFELFDKPSFGMPDFMQKANYYRAIQGELARTIQQMEDIEHARVMIVVPEERLFSKDRKEAKASVLLQLKGNRSITPDQVRSIRFLVSNSVEGLQPSRVAVVDTTGRSLAEDDSSNSIGAVSNTQLSAQKAYEQYLQQKVQAMLDQTLGQGQSTVQISAALNFDAVSQTSERFDPKSATVASENTTSENTHSRTQASGGGATGASPNTGEGDQAAADKSATESNTTKETAQNQYNVNRTVENMQKAMGTPSRVTAAIFVNVRKSGSGPTQSVRPRTPQEIQQLQEMVKEAIGFTQNETRKDSITVQEIEFVPAFDEATAAAAAPKESILSKSAEWMPYVSQGCLFILAIAVLLYMRTILKSSTTFDSDATGEFSTLLSRYKKMADDALVEADREKGSPNSLSVDELSKLIRDNPNNTAQAIKAWMTRN